MASVGLILCLAWFKLRGNCDILFVQVLLTLVLVVLLGPFLLMNVTCRSLLLGVAIVGGGPWCVAVFLVLLPLLLIFVSWRY